MPVTRFSCVMNLFLQHLLLEAFRASEPWEQEPFPSRIRGVGVLMIITFYDNTCGANRFLKLSYKILRNKVNISAVHARMKRGTFRSEFHCITQDRLEHCAYDFRRRSINASHIRIRDAVGTCFQPASILYPDILFSL